MKISLAISFAVLVFSIEGGSARFFLNHQSFKLIHVNYCQPSRGTSLDTISFKDVLKFRSQATSNVVVIPGWVQIVCRNVNCDKKVFIIERCDSDTIICFHGVECRKLATKTKSMIKPALARTSSTLVKPTRRETWYPNDRIM